MSSKLTALTESIIFGDSDQFYFVIDPGGSPLSRRVQSLTAQRYFPMPQNAITGLVLSNDVSDANNDLDIAVGRALAASGDYNLILTSALVKQLDATWAVGTNHGGLDTGSKAVSTWYHIWLIGRPDTHVVDILYSASATAPTMPTSYTKKRRIGAVRTDSSGNLIPFLQYGDNFMWKSPPFLDVDDATLTTTKKNYALSGSPTGLVVMAYANVYIVHATTNTMVYISNPNFTDLAPSVSATPLATIRELTGNGHQALITIFTDTSAQISARSNNSASTLRVSVIGWEDPRGKW